MEFLSEIHIGIEVCSGGYVVRHKDAEFSNSDWVSYRTSAFGDLETLLDFIRTTVMVWEGPAEKPQTVADITKPPK